MFGLQHRPICGLISQVNRRCHVDENDRDVNEFTRDLTNAMLAFFESRTLPKSIKTTWVALIPKIDGAAELSDLDP